MPQYSWYGIDIQGMTHRGTLTAYSHKQLQENLLKEDIAILSYSTKMPWSVLHYPSQHVITSFFDALAILLEAGVFLDDALLLLKKKQSHSGFRMLIDDVHSALHNGISLSQALYPYSQIFGVCALELIASGESVDVLPQALRLTIQYYMYQTEFTKRIKSVILLPAITFLFFIVIAFIILTYIVPVFASMFLAAQKDIPWITRVLLKISDWCINLSLFSIIGVIVVFFYLVNRYFKKPHIKKIKDKYIFFIPFFGHLMYKQNIYQFLQTTALLIEGGIHEIPALESACMGLQNEYIRSYMCLAVKKIKNGNKLADALREVCCFISEEVRTMMVVGEESNTLAQALQQGAQWYKKDVESLLYIVSSLVQPALMIILGIFITALIFAVYMPVLELSYVIM